MATVQIASNPLSKTYIIHQAAFTFMLAQSFWVGNRMIACAFSLTFKGRICR
jgi:hypothetical protein